MKEEGRDWPCGRKHLNRHRSQPFHLSSYRRFCKVSILRVECRVKEEGRDWPCGRKHLNRHRSQPFHLSSYRRFWSQQRGLASLVMEQSHPLSPCLNDFSTNLVTLNRHTSLKCNLFFASHVLWISSF